MTEQAEEMGCALKLWIAAAAAGVLVMLFLLVGGYAWLAAMFVGAVAAILLGMFLTWLICTPEERTRTAPASEPVDPLDIVSAAAGPAAVPHQPAAEAKDAAKADAALEAEKEKTAEVERKIAAEESRMADAARPRPAPEPSAPAATAPRETGQPGGLDAPRAGGADDLKKIKGVGPKLETLLNEHGIFHFDQIAAWGTDEVAWMDENLKGFRGRVSRDDWIAQARTLAQGGETAFSKKVDKGDVY